MELKGCMIGRDLRNNLRLVSWKTTIPTVTIMITVHIPREYMKNLEKRQTSCFFKVGRTETMLKNVDTLLNKYIFC